jgi:hypothetical protein
MLFEAFFFPPIPSNDTLLTVAVAAPVGELESEEATADCISPGKLDSTSAFAAASSSAFALASASRFFFKASIFYVVFL